jgi:HlyD family secretion protein
MGKRWKILLAVIVLAALAAVAAGYRYANRWTGNGADVIRVSGNIEVTDAEVSFKIAGRVESRLVDEGEFVHKGATVALLDRSDLLSEKAMRAAELAGAEAALDELKAGSRPEEIAQAAGAVAQAEAYVAELEAGSRPQEIAVAEATVERARADLAEAETNYNRVKELHARQMSAQQEYDSAKALYEARRAALQEALERLKLTREGPRKEQIDQARAALAQARARDDMVRQGPRRETIEQARARVAQAKANQELTDTRLSYTTLFAPLSGIVLSKNIEPGEYVAPGTPVVTVGDLENVWLRAYVNETDLGRVKVGQHAQVRTDTYPGKTYVGRLSFVAAQAEFTPKNVQTEKERVKLVYRVKIDIPNPNLELKPGMPADAEIQLGDVPAP